MAAGRNEPVFGSFEVRRLMDRVRDLDRLLDRKTMEVGTPKKALAKSWARERTWLPLSPPKDGFR